MFSKLKFTGNNEIASYYRKIVGCPFRATFFLFCISFENPIFKYRVNILNIRFKIGKIKNPEKTLFNIIHSGNIRTLKNSIREYGIEIFLFNERRSLLIMSETLFFLLITKL